MWFHMYRLCYTNSKIVQIVIYKIQGRSLEAGNLIIPKQRILFKYENPVKYHKINVVYETGNLHICVYHAVHNVPVFSGTSTT